MLTRSQLLRTIDTQRIETAIAQAERATSGEIRVSIAPLFWGDVRLMAERAFDKLGMASTRERNGVLIFIAPARHRFVVLGDEGIHRKVGDAFWTDLSGILSHAFHENHFTEGLVAAIERIGISLAEHFPASPDVAVNELPNTVHIADP